MKEETLSDKIEMSSEGYGVIPDWKVKEFIKKLKEELLPYLKCEEGVVKKFDAKINKLAGDDLIHSPRKGSSATMKSEDTPPDVKSGGNNQNGN